MASGGDKTATYSVRVDSNAKEVGGEAAAALEKLRGSVSGSMQSLKEYSATLRSLRGPSDEVKAAKEQLKAKIEAERSAISAGNLELLKAGTSYEKLAEQTKKAAAEAKRYQEEMKAKAAEEQRQKIDALEKSLKSAGGPVQELRERFDKLKSTFTTGAGAIAAVVTVAALAGAALVDLTRKVIDIGIEFGRWIIESADAARSANLLREAWTGSATNAAHLGHQIDELAGKVPIARDKLNEMSGAIVKALNNSRVSGAGIVDTFKAVAGASAAMGDEVGRKLQEIVERAKNTGRVQIGLFELQGTGVSRDKIAQQLAKGIGVSTQAALSALAQGRVKVNDAAKAIREVVEQRFGEINARKLLSLDSQLQRFKDNLAKIGKDVAIEGLLKNVAELGKLFDVNTKSGQALHAIVTTIGNAIGKGFSDQHIAQVKELFERGELAALKLLVLVYKVDNAIGSVFGKDWKGKIFGGAIANAEHEMNGFIRMLERANDLIDRLSGGGATQKSKGSSFGGGVDPKDLGASGKKAGGAMADGVAAGIRSGAENVKGAAGGLATDVKKAFADALGIKSPSKVFQKYGQDTAAGYERGVEGGSRGAQRAVDRMAPEPKAGGAGGAATGQGRASAPTPRAAPVHIEVNIQAGEKAAQQLSEPQFLAGLTKAISDALTGAGLPVQTGPTT
jgi:hypothetical protein